VPVHQAVALEAVADDGQMLGPDSVVAPEGEQGEEDVLVRVEGAFFKEDAGGGGGGGGWEEAEIGVGAGEVEVALGFGEAGFGAGWAAGGC
jgi:hypothetical protein